MMERELASVLRRLVVQLAGRGEYEQAVSQARRWLEIEPLNESAHCELIRLYAWSGDRDMRPTSRALCRKRSRNRRRRPSLVSIFIGSDCGRRPGARTPTGRWA